MEKIKFENTRIPLHYQIADYLLVMRDKGDIGEENRLPTEEKLRDVFGVSRTTIRKALDHLLNKGLLHKQQGKGTFWNQTAFDLRKDEKLIGLNEQIFNITSKTHTRVLSKTIKKIDSNITDFLELPRESDIIEIKRLRYVNNMPMSFTVNYMSVKYGENITKQHLSNMTMLETLEKIVKINLGTIEHQVEITRANKEISENLGISILDPVLTINTRVLNSKNDPIEIVWTYFVEDKYKFRVVLDK